MEFELVARLATGEQRWTVREGNCRIGRSLQNDVILDNSTVSSHHALLLCHGDQVEIEDLASRNHTYVRGQQVMGRSLLRPGDELALGGVRLRLDYRRTPALESTPSARVMTLQELHALTPPPHRMSRLLDLLTDLGGFLVRRHAREEIYAAVLTHVADLVDYQLGCLFLWTGWELNQVDQLCRGAHDREMAFSHTVLETAARNRTPLLWAANPTESMTREHINSALAVPLLDDTQVIGMLYLDTRLLHAPLGDEDLRLISLLATPLALKIASCEVEDELAHARCVQQALLAHLPPVPPGYQLHAHLEACTAVAGDLYDFVALPDGRYAIVLGDVVGKGVSAALQMAALLATIRSTAGGTATPRQLLQCLRQRSCGCLEEHGFVTLFMAYLEPRTGQIEYASAGQDGVGILHPDGRWETLPTTTTPIGLPAFVDNEPVHFDLPPEALLAAWSDGFSEAHTGRGAAMTMFGNEQVQETLGAACGRPLERMATALFDRVREFEGGAPATDDRTLLLLRRTAG